MHINSYYQYVYVHNKKSILYNLHHKENQPQSLGTPVGYPSWECEQYTNEGIATG